MPDGQGLRGLDDRGRWSIAAFKPGYRFKERIGVSLRNLNGSLLELHGGKAKGFRR